jgi:hypothetical protein
MNLSRGGSFSGQTAVALQEEGMIKILVIYITD